MKWREVWCDEVEGVRYDEVEGGDGVFMCAFLVYGVFLPTGLQTGHSSGYWRDSSMESMWTGVTLRCFVKPTRYA